MAEALVVDLADVGHDDRERVGSKAAGLGELLRAGLPVPAGFCVTTAAYSRFAVQPELADVFGAIGLAEADSSHLHSALEDLRAGLLATPVPPDVEDTIRQAYVRFGNKLLAVRSSANLEDLAVASFAGQLDTFLNVIGVDALLDAVRRCWMSLWTDRAMDYRRRIGMDQPGIAMGVVVQVLVPADVAGVLFTANPSTGRRDEIVVNASFGWARRSCLGRSRQTPTCSTNTRCPQSSSSSEPKPFRSSRWSTVERDQSSLESHELRSRR